MHVRRCDGPSQTGAHCRIRAYVHARARPQAHHTYNDSTVQIDSILHAAVDLGCDGQVSKRAGKNKCGARGMRFQSPSYRRWL